MTIRFHLELSQLPPTLFFKHGGAIILTNRHVQFRWNNAIIAYLYMKLYYHIGRISGYLSLYIFITTLKLAKQLCMLN